MLTQFFAAAFVAAAHFGSVQVVRITQRGVPLILVSAPKLPGAVLTGQMTKFGAGHAETFSTLTARSRPAIAVTGTFHCNRTLIPVGDIVLQGRHLHQGPIRSAIEVAHSGEISIRARSRNQAADWGAVEFALCAGPVLVQRGRAAADPWAEGFRDRHMTAPNPRIAVGTCRDGRLIFAVTCKPVHLSQFASALQAAGVMDALNLDGGSSIGLQVYGRTIVRPGRALTNLVLWYDSSDRYNSVRHLLLPVRAAGKKGDDIVVSR
jgi:hypothetical protein